MLTLTKKNEIEGEIISLEEARKICQDILDKEKESRRKYAEQEAEEFYTGYDESRITRVEVIENTQRKYVKWNCNVELDLQDDRRTLKIFVSESEKTNDVTRRGE